MTPNRFKGAGLMVLGAVGDALTLYYFSAPNLSKLAILILRLFGPIYVGNYRKLGWRAHMWFPFYVVYCKKHGAYLDYPSGWTGSFTCPECREINSL